jgi:3-hydroxyacyl-CoA dehydrogenase / enoyl-CoA hydratase / 3-hydroxybutyryl-CoA epimerase
MSDTAPIRVEKGADGVATLILDAPDSSANTMTDAFRDALEDAVAGLEGDTALRGVLVTSAKRTFFAGADLNSLAKATTADAEMITARATRTKGILRRLERLRVPVVAVLAGSAIGGGAELALACHHRVVLDVPGVKIGFPEVTLGLLPGGGGIVRATRLAGVLKALEELLLDGRLVGPAKALELGLVDELAADAAEALTRARAWIDANPDAHAPWDARDFTFPGGNGRSPQVTAVVGTIDAGLRQKLRGAPHIAPHHILAAAIEGSIVDVDAALAIETRYYVDLVTGQVAANMIHGGFLDPQAIARGASRPAGFEPKSVSRVGVVGAGMMGAGIAYSCARSGIAVVLHDVTLEKARAGAQHATTVAEKAVTRGTLTDAERGALVGRITATADFRDLSDCELVVEAVFEDLALKREVYRAIEQVIPSTAVLASNTSTLPIGELAAELKEPGRFIGLHFFSPVDKMNLVEVIRAGGTSDATLAAALDFTAQLRTTPIVVTDSRGFFTSRVFGKFTREGVAMLAEHVPPASINQASMQAGYPVPVLQLSDELSLTLPKKIRQEAIAAAQAVGEPWVAHPSEPVYDAMVDVHGRTGRAGGAGFYDYENGTRTRLWPGLEQAFGPTDKDAVPFGDLVERLLFSEAIEALRCLEEGVIGSSAEANVGSLLGIGYPKWTGGVVQYVNGYPGGPAGFLRRARELADRYGPRFTPSANLVAAAEAGTAIV